MLSYSFPPPSYSTSLSLSPSLSPSPNPLMLKCMSGTRALGDASSLSLLPAPPTAAFTRVAPRVAV